MKKAGRVTPAEFEILELLWAASGDMSVGQVLERLRLERSVAYTTVMTLLDKLHRKRAVARKKKGKAYFYHPQVDKKTVLDRAIQEFSNDYFHGDARKLRSFLRAERFNGSPAKRTDIPGTAANTSASAVVEEEVVLL